MECVVIDKYLGSIYEEFGAWLSATDTPEDDVFDDWWMEWVKMENAGYEEVRRRMRLTWQRNIPSLLSSAMQRSSTGVTCWSPSMSYFRGGWLVKGWGICVIASNIWVDRHEAGEYLSPPVLSLSRF